MVTHHSETLTWNKSQALGPDVGAAVRALKTTDGPDLAVQGSRELIHILLREDLIDHLQLLIYPIVFGKGKRRFDAGSMPCALKLAHSQVSSDGVITAKYERGGEIATGSFPGPNASAAAIERRKRMNG